MGSFDLSRPDFSARFPNSSYDFSRTPSWSDLDLDGLDAWVDLKYKFTRNVFARGAYRYVKYNDNQPYPLSHVITTGDIVGEETFAEPDPGEAMQTVDRNIDGNTSYDYTLIVIAEDGGQIPSSTVTVTGESSSVTSSNAPNWSPADM